jgi:hypothetical protein
VKIRHLATRRLLRLQDSGGKEANFVALPVRHESSQQSHRQYIHAASGRALSDFENTFSISKFTTFAGEFRATSATAVTDSGTTLPWQQVQP